MERLKTLEEYPYPCSYSFMLLQFSNCFVRISLICSFSRSGCITSRFSPYIKIRPRSSRLGSIFDIILISFGLCKDTTFLRNFHDIHHKIIFSQGLLFVFALRMRDFTPYFCSTNINDAESLNHPCPHAYAYLLVGRRSIIDEGDVTFSLTWEYFFPG